MKELLEHLFAQNVLTRTQAKTVLNEIAEGVYDPAQVSAFLSVFRMRPIEVSELQGFKDCLKERCVQVDLQEYDPVDLCGTGGDAKNTFNISTLASFVVAGAGCKVAKHGNYGVSSACGSSNVMEYLGFSFSNNSDRLKKQIEQSNICFLHAPLFHPAMKQVAPIRRSLGIRTFFNMLGPMVNPSSPNKQLVGVFSHEVQRYYKYIYEQQENLEYRIVHSFDGYDEVSLTSQVKVVAPKAELLLKPEDFNSKFLSAEELKGGSTIHDAAKVFIQVLSGNGTEAQSAVVLANAALAIQCCYPQKELKEAQSMAHDSLFGGRAEQAFKKLMNP